MEIKLDALITWHLWWSAPHYHLFYRLQTSTIFLRLKFNKSINLLKVISYTFSKLILIFNSRCLTASQQYNAKSWSFTLFLVFPSLQTRWTLVTLSYVVPMIVCAKFVGFSQQRKVRLLSQSNFSRLMQRRNPEIICITVQTVAANVLRGRFMQYEHGNMMNNSLKSD